VHELYEQHPDEIARFAAALATGKTMLAAWRASFTLTPEALDEEMRRRYATDAPLARRLPPPPLPSIDPDTVTPLAPVDAELMFARVALSGDQSAEAARHLDAAAKLEADAPALALWRARLADANGNYEAGAPILAAALAAHPDHAALLVETAELSLRRELAKPEGARDMAALDPLFARLTRGRPSALALALAAEHTLHRHRDKPELGLVIAEQAVARNSQCVPCLETLANARWARGDVTGAAESLRLAVAAWPHESAPRRLLTKLAQAEVVLREHDKAGR
jgi:hypothetical protein